MDFLVKKLSEAKQNNLKEELGDWGKDVDGKPGFGVNQEQEDFVINTKVEKKERVYIRPNNPIVNKGTLLGMDKAVSSDLLGLGPCVGFADDQFLSFEEPITKAIEDLFVYQKNITQKLFVVGDYIEILKYSTVIHGESKDTHTTKAQTFYYVTHYIEVLDSEKTYRIPTSLFENNDPTSLGAWGASGITTASTTPMNDVYRPGVTTFKELNMHTIEKTYERGVLEEIVAPLKVLPQDS